MTILPAAGDDAVVAAPQHPHTQQSLTSRHRHASSPTSSRCTSSAVGARS